MSGIETVAQSPVSEEPVTGPSTSDDDAVNDAAFEAGYAGTEMPTEPTLPVASESVVPVSDETPPVPPPDEYVQITKAQWEKLQSESASIAELKQEIGKRFDTTFGKMGGLERTLTQLQQATPSGEPVVVTAEDLEELRADGFPDLTKSLAKGLTRVLSKLKGTGPAAVPVDFSAQIAPLVTQALDAQKADLAQQHAVERMTDLHEDWREIAGPKDSQTDYRKWLATQPDGATVLESDNPRVIAKSLTKFLTESKARVATPPVATGRSQRLAEAVPPRGGSGAAPVKSQLTDDEQFEAGFKSGRS